MTNISEFVGQAELACDDCEYKATGTGEGMMHALTTGHTLSGETPDGHQVTIGIEQDDEQS